VYSSPARRRCVCSRGTRRDSEAPQRARATRRDSEAPLRVFERDAEQQDPAAACCSPTAVGTPPPPHRSSRTCRSCARRWGGGTRVDVAGKPFSPPPPMPRGGGGAPEHERQGGLGGDWVERLLASEGAHAAVGQRGRDGGGRLGGDLNAAGLQVEVQRLVRVARLGEHARVGHVRHQRVVAPRRLVLAQVGGVAEADLAGARDLGQALHVVAELGRRVQACRPGGGGGGGAGVRAAVVVAASNRGCTHRPVRAREATPPPPRLTRPDECARGDGAAVDVGIVGLVLAVEGHLCSIHRGRGGGEGMDRIASLARSRTLARLRAHARTHPRLLAHVLTHARTHAGSRTLSPR
jgi:hypothetical protein